MSAAPFSLALAALLFALVASGLAWPLVARRDGLDPAERLVAAWALSLVCAFLVAWVAFVARLPAAVHWIAPALAVAGLTLRWQEVRSTWRDPGARELLAAQAVVTAGAVAWLGWVRTYSGGGWAGDWYEHWGRARFLLEQGPVDTRFLTYPFPARPPLANGVTATLLAMTRPDFAHYQLGSTLVASLAFAPAALLARRWGGPRAVWTTAVLFLLNPLFLQNATFAWTKLPAAFLVLLAAFLYLRAADDPQPRTLAVLSAASLAAGLLAHYSAGPAAVVLAAAWLVTTWRRRADAAWRRATLAGALAGTALLAPWFGWALATYGPAGTLLSNSSVRTSAPTVAEQGLRLALNLRDTLVPHVLRAPDPSLLAQASPWGAVRDQWFSLSQLNLFLALGSAAWLGLLLALAPAWRDAPRRLRAGWTIALVSLVVLGVAVVGERDEWGLTHVCLQPLVLLGLAFLAARLPSLPSWAHRLLLAGAILDLGLGLVLHFGVQNLAFDRWFHPDRSRILTLASYNVAAVSNALAQVRQQLLFFGEAVAPVWPLVAAAPFALLALAVRRWRRAAVQGQPTP